MTDPLETIRGGLTRAVSYVEYREGRQPWVEEALAAVDAVAEQLQREVEATERWRATVGNERAAANTLQKRLNYEEAQRVRAEEALRRIAEGKEPCSKCGKPHEYRWSGKRAEAGTWADPDDGHVYHSMAAAEVARVALSAAGETRAEQ